MYLVVHDLRDEEDQEVLLPCRLGHKEVVALETQMSVVPTLEEWRFGYHKEDH